MASRIVIGGRVLGTGRYGGEPRCLCGEIARVLGRCMDCHTALGRRRVGLPPRDEPERKRLDKYLKAFEVEASKCVECGRTPAEGHAEGCEVAQEQREVDE